MLRLPEPTRSLWFALSLTLLLGGCGPKPNSTANGPAPNGSSAKGDGDEWTVDASKGRIVVVSNSNSPFWSAIERGMQDAARDLKVNASLMRNDGTVAGQIQRLEELSAQKDVKGVAVSYIDAEAKGVVDVLNRLQQQGVYVLTLDSDGPPSTRRAYIGANNLAAGEQAGKAAAALLPQGGKVIAFVGTQAAANARERLDGFKKGAGPKFSVVDVREDNSDKNKARQNVTAAIQSHPEVNVLLGLWSYNAPAIADEVKQAGKRSKYTIVTFDAEPNTLVNLKNRDIDATVVQQPYEYGSQVVKLLNALITKDATTVKRMIPASGLINIPCRTVITNPNGPISTGPNVITYETLQKQLNEKGLRGS